MLAGSNLSAETKIMDYKSWHWRRRSSEKTILAANKVDLTSKLFNEEVQRLPAVNKTGPENSMKNLNEKLASVLLDCHPKEGLVTDHAKPAQEAIAGNEKPAAEAAFVGKEADEALMEQKIRDAVVKTSSEFEKLQKDLENKLAEANKSLAKLSAETSHLNKALVIKEKVIEDLNKQKSRAEAEFNTLMARLDTVEKENAFLKYEHRVLEKELEIRNEEMEYTRRSVDAAHKQQLESVKQITNLEAECQRLHLLMQKKLPGLAASAKMKGEVEMLCRDQMDMRRRKLNPSRDLIVRETPMIERLRDTEEENRTLKEIVTSKSNELQASRMMYSRTASRLSCVEAQLKELCKRRKPLELARYGPIPMSSELSIKSVDNGSDDGISSPGSWAAALISELEHFKDGKITNQLERKAIEVSDMSLMDDFVEMERLAVVSMETPCGGNYHPDVTCKELVPVDTPIKESSQHLESNLSVSILKIIELLEGINIRSSAGYNASDNLSVAPVDYFFHVFRWRSSELSAVLQKFIHTCYYLLNGKADLQKFVGELSFALNWIMNNCVAPQDDPSARKDGLCVQGNLEEENRRLKDELKNMEARLESAADKSQTLVAQLHESEENIGNLESEVKTLKELKEMIEDQSENQKSIIEDLDTQLTVAKAKLGEVFQKFSSLEVELEYKNNCCEELEATCLELQLQLESVAKKEAPKHCIDQDGNVSQNGWEITAASVKLAECQETILNLGKQLKALALPRDAALFDKVFSATNPATTATHNNKKLSKRCSLRDQILAEDGAKAELVKFPNDKVTSSIEDTPRQIHTPERHPDSKNKPSNTAVGSLAVVPSKKRGVGLLMKLLLRRKRGSSKISRSLAKV